MSFANSPLVTNFSNFASPLAGTPTDTVVSIVDSLEAQLNEQRESDLRKMIISIKKNTNYSEKEKQKLIFSLFNKNKTQNKNEESTQVACQHCHPCQPEVASHAIQPEVSQEYLHNHSAYVSEAVRTTVKSLLTSVPVTSSEDKYILSSGGAWIQIPCSQLHPTPQSGKCEHYTRGCSIYTECCRQFFSCRLCHDQSTDHTLNSKDVKVIRCHACSQVQLASNKCINGMCKAEFGEYFCGTCKLWSSGVDIYHCPKCDICLKGKPDIDSKHCETCGYCMPMSHYNNHDCHKYGDEICAMCMEDFKGCLGDVEKTKCGHVFHMSCMEKYIAHEVCCPCCRKTLFDMSERWEEIDMLKSIEQIPDDFKHWRIKFQCNDCLATNLDKFSIYGNKCPGCASYNTTQIDLFRNEGQENQETDQEIETEAETETETLINENIDDLEDVEENPEESLVLALEDIQVND